MISYLGIGVLLGLSAGLAPGPLLTLVVAQTIRYDAGAGVKVALAPLVTDLPIALLAVFVLSRLAGFDSILGMISLVGGCVVMVMGINGVRTKPVEIEMTPSNPRSLLKGVLVNVLSPHAYLFWFSVGAPTVARAYERHIWAPAAFVGGFYLLLVGSKVLLAVLVGKSKKILTGPVYLFSMRGLGLLLCLLAMFLFREGLDLLGAF